MSNEMFPDHGWARESPAVQGGQGLVLEDETLTDVPSDVRRLEPAGRMLFVGLW